MMQSPAPRWLLVSRAGRPIRVSSNENADTIRVRKPGTCLRRATLGLLAFAVIAGSAGAPAHAQTAAEKAKARKLFAQGRKAYAKGQYDSAIATFQQAYALWKNRNILLNVAIAYAESERPAKAIEALDKVLSDADAKTVQAIRERLPAKLKQAESQVGKLEVTLPDPTAQITVDGAPRGTSPQKIYLKAGPHEVTAVVGGEVKASHTVTVVAGRTATWKPEKWTTPKAAPAKPSGPSWFERNRKLPIHYVIAAASVAVVSGIVAIGTGVSVLRTRDDYFATPDPNTRNKGLRLRRATNAFIGIFTVSTLATAALAVFTRWKSPAKTERPTKTALHPTGGPGLLGLGVAGRF